MAATTRPLDLLGLLFLIDFLAGRLVPGGPSWWQPSLTIISILVWVAFVIDYTVRLILSPRRWEFIRAHPLDLLMVLLPMLRVLRAILLVRRSFKNISTERIAGSLLAIVGILVASGAVLEYAVEHNAPGANITTLGLSFWWAIVTTTTVGYGDTYPVTPIGRVIASAIMLVGIGLIGTVSATVAAWFVQHKSRRDGAAGGASTDSDSTDGDSTDSDSTPSDSTTAAAGRNDDAPDVAATLVAMAGQLRELSERQAELQRSIDRLTAPPG
ncbi:potassium channel family protein [Nakamurella sp.]|uniref:potassium channel family protein n=1 Tax=Nakamurella sp. TaxID=1869182 RepID=UPI003784218A